MRDDWAAQAANDRERRDMENAERKKAANLSFGPLDAPAPTTEQALLKTLKTGQIRKDMLDQIEQEQKTRKTAASTEKGVDKKQLDDDLDVYQAQMDTL